MKLMTVLCVVMVLVSLAVLSYVTESSALVRKRRPASLVGSGDFGKMVNAEDVGPLTPVGPLSDKWIVITTIAPPTDDVKFLSSLPGWRVVVVGDVKTPANWSYPNCVFLGMEQQKTLKYISTELIPERSYARKNIGYLYAIQHGAKFIYETDDDNRPLYQLKRFDYNLKQFAGLEFDGRDLFNPYHHFGQSTLWPRGFPLSAVGQASERVYRMSRSVQVPLIQQGIVNGDPDMDAIFRLTRKRADRHLDVHFDLATPTAVLPAGVFSPFNSQNTLFHRDAFWALLIPAAPTMRVCDIWRGYWAQRLLWEIGGRLAFYRPNAYQRRNYHSYLLDAKEEMQLYTDTEKLLTFLREWTCHSHLTFYGCVESLTFELVVAGFWDFRDMELTKAWLADLKRTSYKEPSRRKIAWTLREEHKSDRIKGDQSIRDCEERPKFPASFPEYNTSFVIFYPAEQTPPPMQSKAFTPVPKVLQHISMASDICLDSHNIIFNSTNFSNKNIGINFFDDILVVVSFHYSDFYTNIRYIEAAYRAVFPNIVYCGPDRFKFQEAMQSTPALRKVSFIEADVSCGYLAYACVLEAMRAGYNVNGYLHMSDDVLLNPWAFTRMNKSRVWMTKSSHYTVDTYGKIKWRWWSKSIGESGYNLAVDDIFARKRPAGVKSWDHMLASIESAADGPGNIIRGLVDAYYIPRRLQNQVEWYLSVFLKRSVFLEIAVPVVLYGLESVSDVEDITGRSIQGRTRQKMWDFFDPNSHYMHPVKMSTKRWLKQFCSVFIATMMRKLYGL